MKEKICDILSEIDLEIDEIDLYGYDIIETSLSMVHRLQTVLSDLRTKIQPMYFQQKRMKYYFSRYKNRKYLGGCYFSIRYTGLKHNALMEAMKLLKVY